MSLDLRAFRMAVTVEICCLLYEDNDTVVHTKGACTSNHIDNLREEIHYTQIIYWECRYRPTISLFGGFALFLFVFV